MSFVRNTCKGKQLFIKFSGIRDKKTVDLLKELDIRLHGHSHEISTIKEFSFGDKTE